MTLLECCVGSIEFASVIDVDEIASNLELAARDLRAFPDFYSRRKVKDSDVMQMEARIGLTRARRYRRLRGCGCRVAQCLHLYSDHFVAIAGRAKRPQIASTSWSQDFDDFAARLAPVLVDRHDGCGEVCA